jgi:curved DNA-binding protein CbpA
MYKPSESKNFYEILGIPIEASDEAIRRSWRISVRKHHPDRYPMTDSEAVEAAGKRVSVINEAYATLSDPERRRYYDLVEGVRSAKCASCGNPGKLRLGKNGTAIAVCDSCLNWSNSWSL